MRLKHVPLVLPLALVLALAGCAAPRVPELKLPTQWLNASSQNQVQPNTMWWQALGNDELNVLISRSLVLSPDIALARTRIKEAQGLRLQAISPLWPAADVRATVGEARGDGDALLRTGGLEASWELDLFGGNRAQARSARATVRAAQASAELTRISLVAAVARTYGALWAQRHEVEAATAIYEAAQTEQRFIAARAIAGLASPLSLTQVNQTLAEAQARMASSQQAEAEAARALAVLSGLPFTEIQALSLTQTSPTPSPTTISTLTAPVLVQVVSSAVVLATPLEVIQNRPDVKTARALLEARLADKRAAQALRWPRLTLGAVLGVGGWSATPSSVAATAALPVLNFSAIRGAVQAAGARAEAAGIEYEATVRDALTEIETRLAQLAKAEQQLISQRQANAAATEAYRIVAVRAQAGLEAPTALPRQAQSRWATQAAYAAAQADYLSAYANLFTAVAGAAEPF